MSKVNLGHHYSIHTCPDGSKTIRVLDTVDGEPIEFECINGNIIISGDMSFDYDDVEPCEMTLTKCIQYGKEFLMEWLIHEEIADAIINDLTPWFEKYAISEEDDIKRQIADLKRWVGNRKKRIEDNKKAIRIKESEVRVFTAKAEKYINSHKEENVELQADIYRYAERIRTLKSQLKGVQNNGK